MSRARSMPVAWVETIALTRSALGVRTFHFPSVTVLDNAFVHDFLLGGCATGCCWRRPRAPPADDYFSLRTPLCCFGLPLRMRPVEVSLLNQVFPTLNSLRPLTAPTRCPRPVFFAIPLTSFPTAT